MRPIARRVPHLKNNYLRGNSLNGKPSSPFNNNLNGEGKLKKVEGLVYDTKLDGFNPLKSGWPIVITKDMLEVRLELESEDYDGVNNTTTYPLHVHRNKKLDTSRLFETCLKIADNYKDVRKIGWGGCGHMYSAGCNVGFKGLVSEVALSSKMKKQSIEFRESIKNGLENAAEIFSKEFGDKNVKYEETINHVNSVWTKKTKCPKIVSWIISDGLGNPMHVDDDHSRSFAGWFTKKEIKNRSAWLLFPKHGVAIELCDGTFISWDGIHCDHCSSVPNLSPNNRIFSLFTAVTNKVHRTLQKAKNCQAILKKIKAEGTRLAEGARVEFKSVKINDKVSCLWFDDGPGKTKLKTEEKDCALRERGQKKRKWIHCYIDDIDIARKRIKLRDKGGNKTREHKFMGKSEINNLLVPGWITGRTNT